MPRKTRKTPSTLLLLIHSHLLGGFEPTQFTANHLGGGHSLIRNLGADKIADSLCLLDLPGTIYDCDLVYLGLEGFDVRHARPLTLHKYHGQNKRSYRCD